ncbi:3'-5' exonuclease [bacterium]|nr:3'-5' exonuclease [bacterium]
MALMQTTSRTRWVVVDLETTGMSPAKGDRIVEIGAVAVEDGQITETFSSLIHPERSIPYFVQRIHGISDAMVASAPRFAQVLPQFLAFCADSPLISHNAPFDRSFLDFQSTLVTDAPLPHAHLDTLRVARLLLPKLGKHNLDALVQHFGVSLSAKDRHRALGDARATAEIWLKMEAMAASEGKSLLKGWIRRN